MGVVVWPMVELEADDALASAARIAAADAAGRAGLHLDAGQGSGAVRRAATASCRWTAARGRSATPTAVAEVRRRAGADPRLPRAGRRRRGRIPRHPRYRRRHRRAAPEAARGDRRIPTGRARRPPRRGTAVQASGDPPDERTALSQRRHAALARARDHLRLVGEEDGRAAIARSRARGAAARRAGPGLTPRLSYCVPPPPAEMRS